MNIKHSILKSVFFWHLRVFQRGRKAECDPEIATIDKFGVLHAHKAGEVSVKVYSWDDA